MKICRRNNPPRSTGLRMVHAEKEKVMIDWSKATKEGLEKFHAIAVRAKQEGDPRDLINIHMDIQATHATCPLNLDELLNAPRFDFLHDVYGIANNLNRDTGEIENCFLPRYSK